MDLMSLTIGFLKYFLGTVLLLGGIIWIFLKTAPVFGGEPEATSAERIARSINFSQGQFKNLMPTTLSTRAPESKSSFWRWFFPAKDKNPSSPLPSVRFSPEKLTDNEFIWLGHSTILAKTRDTFLITDPVFFRASPIPIFGKPFVFQHPIKIQDLPRIDAVVISHDHYDHLDAKAIRYLASRVEKFFVPLGVRAHLERWGVESQRIVELDWYESATFRHIELTLTPARHFSGDTGYSETFREIGERFGPFDFAFIENGAYNKDWAQIHLLPEEGVQASIDLNARFYFPIHWSKFDLSLHPWDEPIIRALAAAEQKQAAIVTPLVGEPFGPQRIPQHRWWEGLRDLPGATQPERASVQTAQ
jgi:L-ascorbate metabolism protein UlaG (beta-lactamase superfamily)